MPNKAFIDQAAPDAQTSEAAPSSKSEAQPFSPAPIDPSLSSGAQPFSPAPIDPSLSSGAQPFSPAPIDPSLSSEAQPFSPAPIDPSLSSGAQPFSPAPIDPSLSSGARSAGGSPAPADRLQKYPNISYICMSAAIGGLLFGFDTAVISGTISPVKLQYALNATSEGWFVSSGLAGCILGVIACSFITDRLGRKNVMIVSGIMFLLSAIGCAFALNFEQLVTARLLGGVGVGMASVVSPMYIAEFAPASARGKMIAYYQLAITLGILLAYLSNAFILNLSKTSMQSLPLLQFMLGEAWRPMFLVMAIPSAAFIATLLAVPESPRWLFSINKKQEAERILCAVKGREQAQQEIENMQEAESRQTNERSMFEKSLRLPLVIGVTLAILQQFCGINAIIYYGPRIFETAGIAGGDALTFQVIIGVINVLFTFIAIHNADKYGRKFLLLSGLTGIVSSLIACGALFAMGNSNSIALLGMILMFIACFALSLGPITWIMINEIFPTQVRARAVSFCTLTLWVAVWMVGQFFPWLLEKAGPAFTFWTFAFFSTVNMLFSWKVVRETKNKTLEEVEQLFVAPH